MKNDIINGSDIELLINSFYEKVKQDDVIGFVFNDIVKVQWDKHLPVIYDFWESQVFFTNKYTGNAMSLHMRINELVPLNKEHFRRWLKLFTTTVDELFEGKKANIIKEKAISIATIMETKIISPVAEGLMPRPIKRGDAGQ